MKTNILNLFKQNYKIAKKDFCIFIGEHQYNKFSVRVGYIVNSLYTTHIRQLHEKILILVHCAYNYLVIAILSETTEAKKKTLQRSD